ncbi:MULTISPECIES: hypothetical protein [Leptospira]|uniref:Uncharacterized protein n=2 Tax=Leptospira kirschneri TaxID=29507 RepID=A0A828Y548_9LEPT|nr:MULTISPECIES: hypothetical protein [Leptospira]EMO77912.1 hypothetical protein LEP1GSC127_1790 [Leptospira kirschneri str. 200801925]EJO69187.1 hypothetical protein LEP1GSC044_3626 [Leptospira kirschneri serovar Grippotyphosa str. RM52]EKO52235.1 hypothetical protein LEP1GSC131_3543 [Leptospira kirschneri str. 200802841]EKR06624.1 hypothetical protein LEP1GSC122_1058 [Leptospira kirschneri serovar Valbuzzi str. 200702274]EMK03185.1 hypothetical protein LEP1GSC176_3480 [Leptospira kirschneri
MESELYRSIPKMWELPRFYEQILKLRELILLENSFSFSPQIHAKYQRLLKFSYSLCFQN